MGAWGYGIFENDHDQDIICELNSEAGMDKLEAALEKRIKEKKLTPKEHEQYVEKKLPPYYTICGGGSSAGEIRKHLDSGVLDQLLETKEKAMLTQGKKWFFSLGGGYPDYTFVMLGACAMTLGCHIPQRYKVQLQKQFLYVGLLETPERQMFQALNGPDGYKEGVPYEFEEPADVTAAHDAEMKAREAKGGSFVLMNVPAPFGLFPRPPPKNQALRSAMEEGKFGTEGCGGCGCKKKDDGSDLLRCAKCKKRGYCSAECQKEHWKLHKKVCKAAAEGKENVTAS